MKKVLSVLIVFWVHVSYSQIKTKSITEFSQKENKVGILVDVRTPEEFQQGHLDHAININWFDNDFAKRCQRLDKGKPIFVYCKMGGRSIKAAKALDSLGFKNVVNLTGGYDAFKNQETTHH